MSAEDELRIARARAIEAYAKVESELCYLMSALLDTTHDKAAIIFFKIVAANSRNTIIGDLLEHVHGDKFKFYWNGQARGPNGKPRDGISSHLGALDGRRNEIVHWHRVDNAMAIPDGKTKKWPDLRPAFWWARSNAAPLSTVEMNKFIDKAEFIEQSVRMFWRFIRQPNKLSADELATWPKIFEQSAPYPPQKGHPLYKSPKA